MTIQQATQPKSTTLNNLLFFNIQFLKASFKKLFMLKIFFCHNSGYKSVEMPETLIYNTLVSCAIKFYKPFFENGIFRKNKIPFLLHAFFFPFFISSRIFSSLFKASMSLFMLSPISLNFSRKEHPSHKAEISVLFIKHLEKTL